MRGAWDDGGLVPEGAVMADVEGAITCAFMPPSSGHTRVEPWRKPSLLSVVCVNDVTSRDFIIIACRAPEAHQQGWGAKWAELCKEPSSEWSRTGMEPTGWSRALNAAQ